MIQAWLRKSVSFVPWRWRGVIKRLPLVAPLQRWLLTKFLEGREFVHTVDAGPARGLRYPITLPADKGIWTGTYELNLATRIAGAVRPGDVCLDIGGWRGFFGAVMALAGASKVFIFEPLPANAAQVRRMAELNPNLPIELVESAVAQSEGRTDFAIMPETSMGKLTTSRFQGEEPGKAVISVRVETLDHAIEARIIQKPDVVKVDVEGAEAMVLRGGERLFRIHGPRLFIEIHSRQLARECSDFLAELGYAIEVVETKRAPDFYSEPEVCHFVAGRAPFSNVTSAA